MRRISTVLWLILAVALLLRVLGLEWRPPHHDEAVNGWFVDQMASTGYYAYDPENYHGPLHFYALYVSQAIFGTGVWQLRLPTVLVGLASILLLFQLGRMHGRMAAVWVAVAMAVSPAFLFYSRNAIHEIWQVFFLLLVVWGMAGLLRGIKRRSRLWAVAMGLAGLILTKETYVIHVGCMLLAWPTLWLWEKLLPSQSNWPPNRDEEVPGDAKPQWRRWEPWEAAGVAVFLVVVFYSGFFRNLHGLAGLWTTFAPWFETGFQAGAHEKEGHVFLGINYYWLELILFYETPAFLGLLAGLWFMARGDRWSRWLAIMAAGTLVAYTIIPYKTPWCIISILWPFYLVAAAFAAQVPRGRNLFWSLGWLAVAFSLYQSIQLNYRFYTDDRHPYVYVQTYKDINEVVNPLLELADRLPERVGVPGAVLTGDYFPFPWLLRDFRDIGYYGRTWPESLNRFDLILVEEADAELVERQLQGEFYVTPYRLRSAAPPARAYFRAQTFRLVFPERTPEFQSDSEEGDGP